MNNDSISDLWLLMSEQWSEVNIWLKRSAMRLFDPAREMRNEICDDINKFIDQA
jgi:hypothetical protein